MTTLKNPKTVLCLHIIGTHFGPITEAVAKIIIRTEQASLSRIVEAMRLECSFDQKKGVPRIRDALLVLLQHNCLFVRLLEEEESGRSAHRALYAIDMDAVLNRLRIPQAIRIARDLFGEIGMLIAEAFFFHGRLGAAQLVEDIVARRKVLLEQAGAVEEDGASEQMVKQVFDAMATMRFLEKAAPLSSKRDVSEEADTFEENAAASKAASKLSVDVKSGKSRGKAATNASAAKKAGQAPKDVPAVSSAAPKRKRAGPTSEAKVSSDFLPVEMRAMMHTEEGDSEPSNKVPKLESGAIASSAMSAPSISETKATGARGRRPKLQGATAVEDVHAVIDSTDSTSSVPIPAPVPIDDAVLWTFGWTQCTRYRRNEVCTKLVSERMGGLAAAIVKVMLAYSITLETTPLERTTHSIPMALSDIIRSVSIEANATKCDHIPRVLDLLRNDRVAVVTMVKADISGGDRSFMVNIQVIIEFLKSKTIHSIICEKFGDISGRIFELLLEKRYLDQQRIGDLAIAPPRDVRRLMYQMFRNKFIDYVDVSKRADFNTLSTVFLWHVNKVKLKVAVMDLLYKAALNLQLRREEEHAQRKDVLELFERNHGTGFDGSLGKRFDSFMMAIGRLDSSLIQLAETITVMDIL